jgi:hypothetical protein
MKNTAQQIREQRDQEAKRLRAENLTAKLDEIFDKPQSTIAELKARLEQSRLVYAPSLQELDSLSLRNQAEKSGLDSLKAFSEGDDVKGRYLAGCAFNLALHSLASNPLYFDFLEAKYKKVFAFKVKNQGKAVEA